MTRDPNNPASTGNQAHPARRERAAEESVLLQVVTLVLWLACLCIGVLGLLMPYPRPHPPPEPEEPAPPVHAEMIKVDLAPAPLPPADAPPPDPSDPPPELAAVPPLPAVAPATPAIAFAVPMEGPVRIVDAKYAGSGRPARALTPVAKRIVYGQGEGAQPPPEYPREAIAAGEQGVVGARFSIGEDGRVQSVNIIAPCQWPLLNQSVANAILYTWHYPAGARRSYDINLTFRLNPL